MENLEAELGVCKQLSKAIEDQAEKVRGRQRRVVSTHSPANVNCIRKHTLEVSTS